MQWLIHVKTPAQTCFQNTELTLEMFRKISTSSCHQIPNELSNLLALVATCSTQTVNQNTNVPAEVCKVPIKRTCGLTVNYDLSALLNTGELLGTIFTEKTSGKFKFFCILLVTCATLKQANLAFPTSNDGQISSTTC